MQKIVWRQKERFPAKDEREGMLFFLVEKDGKLFLDFLETKFNDVSDSRLLAEFESDLSRAAGLGVTFWRYIGYSGSLDILPEPYRSRLQEQLALESL